MSTPSAIVSSGAAAGLVGISTTRPQGIGLWADRPRDLDTISTVAEWSLEIDRIQARIRRLQKAVSSAGDALQRVAGARDQKIMVTLTYRGTNADWKANHVANYIHAVRKWYSRITGGDKLRYVWVAELQQRGVIHYHCVIWLRKGITMPKADKRGWWPHGMSNTMKATRPVGYLMKYASKADSKTIGRFPHGARIYGAGGLDAAGKDTKRWMLWPSYVQGNAAVGDPFKPATGGGYINRKTGEFLQSEYAPLGASFRRFIRLRETPRQVQPSGPFSWAYPADSATIH